MFSGILHTKDYCRFEVRPIAADGEIVRFEGATKAGRALPGDIVHWNGTEATFVSRSKGGHLFLVGLLELAAKVRYGMTARGAPIYRFSPMNPAYPPFFVGCSAKDTSQNLLVRIEFADWPVGATCPRGTLIQTYGPAGDLATEEEALFAHYAPLRWKKGEFSLDTIVRPPHYTTLKGAALGGTTFHIDPPGCRDIDDAITILPGEGETILKIHIADVANWLLWNIRLAEKGAALSQTLYRDGAAVRPMFPPELSEGLFSLLPGEQRCAWTLTLRWDTAKRAFQGEPGWALEEICVRESYTYETAVAAPWAESLTELCSALAKKPITDPHEWIEVLMITYNREVARMLRKVGVGVLRRHSQPDQERFTALEALGLPAQQLASRAGEYCLPTETEVGHWGLGLDVYCHATSPIRRWADCLCQMALRWQVLYGYDSDFILEITSKELEQLNAGAKAAKAYERDLTFLRALVGPGAQKEVAGVVVETGRLWVPSWGRIVRCVALDAAVEQFPVGTPVRAKLYCNAGERNWKRRIVMSI